MEPKKSSKTFAFQNRLRWTSRRRAVVSAAGKPDVVASSPPEFKGEAGFWTPEDMFLASVNLCTLLTFVAFAQHKGLDLVSYESSVDGLLENVEGRYRFTEVTLRPRIVVSSPEDVARAEGILDEAHKACLITNSIISSVKITPEIDMTSAAAA